MSKNSLTIEESFLFFADSGISRISDMAEALGCTKGAASKIKARLQDKGELDSGRKIKLAKKKIPISRPEWFFEEADKHNGTYAIAIRGVKYRTGISKGKSPRIAYVNSGYHCGGKEGAVRNVHLFCNAREVLECLEEIIADLPASNLKVARARQVIIKSRGYNKESA